MRPDIASIERRYQFRSEQSARDIAVLFAYIAELEAEVAALADNLDDARNALANRH